jgi:hypothetical protein
VSYTPPPEYASWWQLTERCSGREGEFRNVRWLVVPDSTYFDVEGETVQGAYYPDGDRIVLAHGWMKNGQLVRHEMLHALLNVPGHPRDEFLGACGDIVVCIDACIRDAGGPPDTSATAPLVPPSAVAVATVVTPGRAYLSKYQGWLTVMVTATNTLSHPVRASIPLTNQIVRFWFNGIGDGQGRPLDPTVAFAPAGTAGSTRRYVFTVQPASPEYYDLVPGSYTVRGAFAGLNAATAPFSLGW